VFILAPRHRGCTESVQRFARKLSSSIGVELEGGVAHLLIGSRMPGASSALGLSRRPRPRPYTLCKSCLQPARLRHHKFLHFLPSCCWHTLLTFVFPSFVLSSLFLCSNNPALFAKAFLIMTSSSKPSMPLSKVPSVKELCELLGFQQASLKDTNTFMEAARAWRKSYHTSSGRPATDLLHWNQPSDQLDLEEMAQDFLDKRGGNGERFWSPDRSWNRDSDFQLPKDRAQYGILKKLSLAFSPIC